MTSLAALATNKQQAVTRAEVLEIAAEIFAGHGYRAASLKLVAERLNVTRQALYYHFDSKGAILAALFDRLMTALEDEVNNQSAERTLDSKFASMVRAHMGVIINNAHLAAVLLHERHEIALLPEIDARARRRNYMRAFVTAYKAGVKENVLKPLDPLATVNAVLASINAVSWWYRPSRDATPEESQRVLYALLSSGFNQPAA